MDLYDKNRKALRKFKKWLKLKQEEEEFKGELLELEDEEELNYILEDEVEDFLKPESPL